MGLNLVNLVATCTGYDSMIRKLFMSVFHKSVDCENANRQKFSQENQNMTVVTVPTSASQILRVNVNHTKLK